MARFTVTGLSPISTGFGKLADLPASVLTGMLDAEGTVVERAQKQTARSMLTGPYYKGLVANACKKGKAKKSGDGAVLNVTFEGSVSDEHHKKSTRIAEIAYINEFGKTGQPARPFIATANEQCAEEAGKAAETVLNAYIDSCGL